jgi:putative membrane protein
MNNNIINKDLILREKLAIERTEMANDRTFLSFIRTGLYFSIAGITINEVLKLRYGLLLEVVFIVLAALIIITGIVKYTTQKRKIRESKKHIGNYKLEWEDDLV